MSERNLLKKARHFENLVRTYTELIELNSEILMAAAEAEAETDETAIRRELAERIFPSLDKETVRQAILSARIKKEEQEYRELQLEALRAGHALTDEENTRLAAAHEKRLDKLVRKTDNELLDFPDPTMEPSEAEKYTAEAENRIRKMREQKLARAQEKAQQACKRIENRLAAAKAKLEAVESKLAKEHSSPAGVLADGLTLGVTDLKMYFGGVKAVDGLSFDVQEGEIFGLIGPNGAGKTTVFNCITQFYKPTGGTLLFRTREGKIVDLTREKVHDVILYGIVRTF